MPLCDFELAVLSHVHEPRDDDGIRPGAALWAAAEALAVAGYIRRGALTEKGREALKLYRKEAQMIRELGNGA